MRCRWFTSPAISFSHDVPLDRHEARSLQTGTFSPDARAAKEHRMSTVDRRSFLRRSSWLAGAAIVAPSLSGLVACADRNPVAPYDGNGVRLRHARAGMGGYGELKPSKDCPEISLPAGFHAARLSVRGDLMDDGNRVAQALDGMG